MQLNSVEIEDTFAEAFTSYYSRFIITATNEKWAKIAAQGATGYATSLVGCTGEAGIEQYISPEETPDRRPGYVVQVWAPKSKLKDELLGRIGQCVLTAPTTAVWNFCDSKEKLDIGYKLRFFGDGYEKVEKRYGMEVVVIPIMLGEFLIEKELGISKGIAGGNFLIFAESQKSALEAAEKAVEAISSVGGVITPFPGGICASGSKVGSRKYAFMRATTNEQCCPTICNLIEKTKVKGVGAVAEIVIDGISEEKVKEAMRAGIESAAKISGVKKITAENYGGTLGNVRIRLRELSQKKI